VLIFGPWILEENFYRHTRQHISGINDGDWMWMQKFLMIDNQGDDEHEQAQGLQHPDTLRSMHKLSCIWKSQVKEKTKGDERVSEYEMRNENSTAPSCRLCP
jgi:hypothetical protein